MFARKNLNPRVVYIILWRTIGIRKASNSVRVVCPTQKALKDNRAAIDFAKMMKQQNNLTAYETVGK